MGGRGEGGGVYECCVGDGPNLIDKFCQRSVGGRFRFGGRWSGKIPHLKNDLEKKENIFSFLLQSLNRKWDIWNITFSDVMENMFLKIGVHFQREIFLLISRHPMGDEERRARLPLVGAQAWSFRLYRLDAWGYSIYFGFEGIDLGFEAIVLGFEAIDLGLRL